MSILPLSSMPGTLGTPCFACTLIWLNLQGRLLYSALLASYSRHWPALLEQSCITGYQCMRHLARQYEVTHAFCSSVPLLFQNCREANGALSAKFWVEAACRREHSSYQLTYQGTPALIVWLFILRYVSGLDSDFLSEGSVRSPRSWDHPLTLVIDDSALHFNH